MYKYLAVHFHVIGSGNDNFATIFFQTKSEK